MGDEAVKKGADDENVGYVECIGEPKDRSKEVIFAKCDVLDPFGKQQEIRSGEQLVDILHDN